MGVEDWSRGRRTAMSFLLTAAAVLTTLVIAELAVRVIKPWPSLYPRLEYSREYGTLLYPGRTIIHEKPGHWRFTYSVNDYRYRGPSIPIVETYEKSNIVMLGDSYTFGTGVNDGEEFAAVLAESLEETHDVINLGVGGWGLTQQIRRYHDFGALYKPDTVVLQFCGNDRRDNFRNKVTVIEDGQLAFRNTDYEMNGLKRYLAGSIIQRSQLYQLFRQPFVVQADEHDRAAGEDRSETLLEGEIPLDQHFYCELLDIFARQLHDSGIQLIFIWDGPSLDRAPFIRQKVEALQAEGILSYYDTREWLADIEDYHSPEGHIWGKKAHAVIGANLARIIRDQADRALPDREER